MSKTWQEVVDAEIERLQASSKKQDRKLKRKLRIDRMLRRPMSVDGLFYLIESGY